MKKLTYSIVAFAAIGTFLVAGGDIAPIEPIVETPVVIETDAGFYVGGAYGLMGFDYKDTATPTRDLDMYHNSVMLQTGYKFNSYVAVEGRYWAGAENDIVWPDGTIETADVDAWGIYVKPMYPVTEALDVYALLGYGSADLEIYSNEIPYDTDGFQWGLGLSYDINMNIAVFMDYVNLYNDTKNNEDILIVSLNFGVTYKF